MIMILVGIAAMTYFAYAILGGLVAIGVGLLVLLIGVPVSWLLGRRGRKRQYYYLDDMGMPVPERHIDENGIPYLQ